MNPNLMTRDLLGQPGLLEALRERGVLLDEWDQRLTLAELCWEYDLDLREVLAQVQQAQD